VLRALKRPAARPIPIRGSIAAILWPIDPIGRLAEAPAWAALILDVDGTLAPIVPRRQDARVPPETQAELERLAGRYALVACLSGRASEDAKRVVGVEGLTYVGVHGLELEPEAERWRAPLQELVAAAGWPEDDTEDKGLTVSLHYRRAADENAARARLDEIAAQARAAGLDPRFGRKVLDLRPPVAADKGTAVRHLLAEAKARAGLYAGDDTTDLDAFRGLREAGLDPAVRVAVDSAEAPPDLLEQADLMVDGPEGLRALLHEL
jgi:trehalose 6-phosphate phosphatase